MVHNKAVPLIILSIVSVILTVINGLPAQKKGIFDEFYDDDDLSIFDDTPVADNGRDYEIVYDTRQKGEENYRVHIDGVHVIMNSEPLTHSSSDLMEAVEAMYGMGNGNNEEISFVIGGISPSSTTTNKVTTEKEVSTTVASEMKEPSDQKEATTVKEDVITEKIETISTNKITNADSSLKRNTDFQKRRYKLSDIISGFFHKRFANQ
uniref:CSON002557 protein n=1 Tax=Culicoides sonorensis TaxID=179676 RepID=A0A336MJN4_CULSO